MMKQKWTWIGLSVVALGLYLLANLESVGLRGSVQTNLLDNKDAVADILPPPLYMIESDLLINQFIHTVDEPVRESLLIAIKKEYNGFLDRKNYWLNSEFYKTASFQKEFAEVFSSGEAVFDRFLKWQGGDRIKGLSDELIEEKVIMERFQDHRKSVLKLVKILRDQQSQLLVKSDSEFVRYKFVIVVFLLFLSLLVFLLRTNKQNQIVELSKEQLWLPLLVAIVSYWFYGQIGEKLNFEHGRGYGKYFDLFFVGLVTVLAVRLMRVRYLNLANQILASEQKYRTLLQSYSHDIVGRIEEEKKKISREVHDGVVQLLGSVKFRLEGLKQKIENHTHIESSELGRPIELLQSSITDLRQLCYALRPSLLDNVGLITAMRSLIDDFEKRSSIVLVPDFEFDDQKLGEQLRLDLFRIFQELLSNCEKHANATEATINIFTVGRHLNMVYSDNGRGADLKTKGELTHSGLGLVNIRERVRALDGKVEVSTSPGNGFQVRIELPLESQVHESKVAIA